MNEWLVLAIHVGVGAVAGFVTNGLAVVSLFRPHRAPKIGGLELKMFQGVIPKRIDALAESIGRLVEEELLTDDVVKDILLSEDTKAFVSSIIVDGAVNSLSNDRRTLAQIGEDVLGLAPEMLHNSMPRWLGEKATGLLASESAATFIAEWVEEIKDSLLDSRVADAIESELYFTLRYGLRERLRDVVAGGVVKEQLLTALDRRLAEYESSSLTVDRIIPDQARTQIRRWILAEGPALADQLVEWLNSPGMTDHLQQIIDGVIDSFPKLGQWIARRFDRRLDLARQIILQLTRFLESPENQKQLLLLVSEWLDKLWSMPLHELVQRLGREHIHRVAELLLDRLLTVGRADAVLDRIDAWLRAEGRRTWRDLLAFGGGPAEEAEDRADGRTGGRADERADNQADGRANNQADGRTGDRPSDQVSDSDTETKPDIGASLDHALDRAPARDPRGGAKPDIGEALDRASYRARGHGSPDDGAMGKIPDSTPRPVTDAATNHAPDFGSTSTPRAGQALRKAVTSVLQSPVVREGVTTLISSQWKLLLTLTPADLASRLRFSDLKQARAAVFTAYERIVRNMPPGTVAKLPIATHVEGHVRSLPLPIVERQLRSVLGREMRAVTFMGAWLGLIVGAVGYLVQMYLER